MRKFQRKIEDFKCEKCGSEVRGNGYTNHCPRCLWSKHVDINPGDRLAACQGLMEPLEIEYIKDSYIIIHRCAKCGYEKKNSASSKDEFEKIIEIFLKNQPHQKEIDRRSSFVNF
jgi:ribosomal protein L37AE/L43A